MKRIYFFTIIVLILLGCKTQPAVVNTSSNTTNINREELYFLTRIEYHQSFIGKSVPANYKPVKQGSNIYEIEGPYVLGQEIVNFGVDNGLIERVWVMNYFENSENLFKWFDIYYKEAESLKYGSMHVDDGMFFTNGEKSFMFKYKLSDLYSGELEFR